MAKNKNKARRQQKEEPEKKEQLDDEPEQKKSQSAKTQKDKTPNGNTQKNSTATNVDKRKPVKKAKPLKTKDKVEKSKDTETTSSSDSSDDNDSLPAFEEDWDEEAKNLYKAMKSGKFDHLVAEDNENSDDDNDGADFEEVDIDDEDDSDVNNKNNKVKDKDIETNSNRKEEEVDNDENSDSENSRDSNDDQEVVEEEEEGDLVEEEIKSKATKKNEKLDESHASNNNNKNKSVERQAKMDDRDNNAKKADKLKSKTPNLLVDASSSSDDDDSDNDDHDNTNNNNNNDTKEHGVKMKNTTTLKALAVVTEDLQNVKRNWPWAETFSVISKEALPFGKVTDEHGIVVSIHDDLKREVAFYDMALDAAIQGRKLCEKAKIPFSRPDDFFAEMVKTDDHMAKVKDRLIFETKKIEAVAQRKSRKEQALRAKETQAHKQAEKAKRQKQHFNKLQEWSQEAASNRGKALMDNGKQDAAYLQRLNGESPGGRSGTPSRKRQRADEKYGKGGPRGRFKQNDPKALNDSSGFNPRGGNFAGGKKVMGRGGGAKRPGKRARDAKRQKR